MTAIKRFIFWSKSVMHYLLLVFMFTLFASYTRTMIPQFTQHAIDTIISGKDSSLPAFIQNFINLGDGFGGQLLFLGIALVIFQAVRGLFLFLLNTLKAKFAEGMAENMRNKLYSHIQDLSYSYHTNSDTGDLIQRCTSDIDQVRQFAFNQLPQMLWVIMLLFSTIYQMLKFNVFMTLATLFSTPIIFAFSYLYFKKIKETFTHVEEAESKMTTTLQENLTGIRVVKAFNRGKHEIDKFKETSEDYSKKDYKLLMYMAYYWPACDFLVNLQYLITILIGGYLVMQGSMTVGVLALFLTYVNMVLWPVRGLGRMLADFGRSSVSLNRIAEIMDNDIEYHDYDSMLKPEIEGSIEFENVSFKFDDSSIDLLEDISFSVNAGENVAIMGRTGSGKSTLVHLLNRLVEYQSGSIRVDGVELKDISKKWIRKNIGVILQEPFLYSRTVFENIGITHKKLDRKKITEAAQVACVHNDIQNFEKGYDTIIGERGVTLSGGQRQRVAIARMLIDERPILVFDDSLSAVDTETDASIRKALKVRNDSTTVFIITHRVQTAMVADRIVVLDGGKVAAMGTHEELLSQGGFYKELWDIQTKLESEHSDQQGGEIHA